MKEIGIDRLSQLPDCLLISILSLLSTRDAIRTCVLSRRWLFLWTDLPALAFEEDSLENDKISKFVAGVCKYLTVCGGSHLQRFKVSFKYDEGFASDVNTCVQFALRHKVKDVALLLETGDDYSDDDYLLPQMMYSNSYLTRLSLQECVMAPKNTVQWGALSSLYLKRVEFHEKAIKNMLSGCPVLCDLTLDDCWHNPGLNCLHVESQSLRELTIIGCFDDDDDNEILMEISAPLIHYANARISADVERRKFELSNISSLVEVDIDFMEYQPDGMPELIGYTTRLLRNLRHVKKLKVGPEFIRALGDMVVEEDMQLSQYGVECLQLNARIYNEDTVDGIVCLLKSSPNIKKLFISLWCEKFQDELDEIELSHDLLHLKTVTIKVHEKPELVAETMLELVRLLLKRGPALEKLVINFSFPPSVNYSPWEYMKIYQELLSCPRASAEAIIELSPATFSR